LQVATSFDFFKAFLALVGLLYYQLEPEARCLCVFDHPVL